MSIRFRRSARLGPLRFNFAKGGLSSISVGGRGASFNIPVSRSGGPRTTVGLPDTGLSSDDPAALVQFYGALLGAQPQPGLSAAHWRMLWPAGGWLELYAPSRNRPQPRQ
jgi:hypothetical protein